MIVQIILTIFLYALLCTIVYLLYRHAIGAGAKLRQTTLLLAEANLKSADAAQKAAEAAQKLAEIMEKKHAD